MYAVRQSAFRPIFDPTLLKKSKIFPFSQKMRPKINTDLSSFLLPAELFYEIILHPFTLLLNTN